MFISVSTICDESTFSEQVFDNLHSVVFLLDSEEREKSKDLSMKK